VLAKPFGAVSSLIQGRVVMVPVAVSGRKRLRRDHWPPADGAIRRRIALLGESCVLEIRANPAASPMNVVALNIGFFLCNLHDFVGEGVVKPRRKAKPREAS